MSWSRDLYLSHVTIFDDHHYLRHCYHHIIIINTIIFIVIVVIVVVIIINIVIIVVIVGLFQFLKQETKFPPSLQGGKGRSRPRDTDRLWRQEQIWRPIQYGVWLPPIVDGERSLLSRGRILSTTTTTTTSAAATSLSSPSTTTTTRPTRIVFHSRFSSWGRRYRRPQKSILRRIFLL